MEKLLVELKNVSFSYHEQQTPALNNIRSEERRVGKECR